MSRWDDEHLPAGWQRRALRTFALAVGVMAHVSCASAPDVAPPSPLSNDEFWTLSTSLSEPAGEFVHSDNLVSNEAQFAGLTQRGVSTSALGRSRISVTSRDFNPAWPLSLTSGKRIATFT